MISPPSGTASPGAAPTGANCRHNTTKPDRAGNSLLTDITHTTFRPPCRTPVDVSMLCGHHFDGQHFLDRVVSGNQLVDPVERRGMEVPLAALPAHFRLHILDDLELAFEPVLLLDLLRACLRIAELAFHPLAPCHSSVFRQH